MNSVQKYLGGNKPSDSLTNYLRAAGYDVDNLDDADVRRNGMAMLSNAKGTTLSDDDYGKATTELQRYLSIGAGQDAYRQSVADAENEAKRTVAYNEYLDQRVASYLGEIEGAAGQKGYTGVTEGNRIALRNSLANRQQSVATAKDKAKQSALSNYLKVEDQANADYFSNMDATESATQSRRDTQVNNVKGEIGEAMSAASSSLEGLDDDTIARWRNYIRNYDFEDEGDRKKVLTWYNALYGGSHKAGVLDDGSNGGGTDVVVIDYNGTNGGKNNAAGTNTGDLGIKTGDVTHEFNISNFHVESKFANAEVSKLATDSQTKQLKELGTAEVGTVVNLNGELFAYLNFYQNGGWINGNRKLYGKAWFKINKTDGTEQSSGTETGAADWAGGPHPDYPNAPSWMQTYGAKLSLSEAKTLRKELQRRNSKGTYTQKMEDLDAYIQWLEKTNKE